MITDRCAKCGRARDNHNRRHPFQSSRVVRDTEGERRELLMRAEVLLRLAEERLSDEEYRLQAGLRELALDIARHLIPSPSRDTEDGGRIR